MVPRKPKPKPKPEPSGDDDDHDDHDDNTITVGGKNLNVRLDLQGRGIVLIYALAFAIVFGTIGWVVFQIITALKITGGDVRESVGFILCMLITSICALLSR